MTSSCWKVVHNRIQPHNDAVTQYIGFDNIFSDDTVFHRLLTNQCEQKVICEQTKEHHQYYSFLGVAHAQAASSGLCVHWVSTGTGIHCRAWKDVNVIKMTPHDVSKLLALGCLLDSWVRLTEHLKLCLHKIVIGAITWLPQCQLCHVLDIASCL